MGDPVRILHVVVNMNRGGAETLLMNLYRNIDRTKIQFDFLTCYEGVFDEEIRGLGGQIHRIPYVPDVGHFGYVKALQDFFQTHPQYKVVHSHMDKMTGIVLDVAKRNQIPVRIAHSHNTSSEGGIAAKLYKWYAGTKIIPSATHLFACSEKAANWLYSSKSNLAKVIKNGIETSYFQFSKETREEMKKELQLHEDAVVIGHIGRFNHQKNHAFLIDIFQETLKTIPNAILVLAGDGPLRSEIEKKIKVQNLEDRVKVLGVRSDINRLLQVFDVFVFPSFHEGLPVTLIEAQGAGVPCVITDVISTEVDMGMGLISFVPLKEKELWVNHIHRSIVNSKNRSNVTSNLEKNGYDIKQTAQWTQGFYLGFR
ncbi:glycosyltransferase family 1 protein [Bacillus alkalicellulosilyticus]|uniref:glycosyltransferase family 1 protein n=1 Tax=Alkalihalobacterium alkalicellulosilyticum TaxID=1912214 RepID=UPI000997A944|nr:glycosyltransferase family 1 protein [Bacillus alkalicellulosilyticus]